MAADVPRKMMESGAGAAAGGDAQLQQQAKPVPQTKEVSEVVRAVAKPAEFPTKGDTIHTLCTSNGSPYLNFQNRIMCALNPPSTARCDATSGSYFMWP